MQGGPGQVSVPFRDGGGEFLASPGELEARLGSIRGFLFDWDGVFNPGTKGAGSPSGFSEADSMGTNLLRFAWWLRSDGVLPFIGILTGQENPTAVLLAERERFQVVYRGFLDKLAALEDLRARFGIRPDELCFVFDDVLDLGVAARCGLRVLVRNRGAPLLNRYVAREGLCEYVTGREGGGHAVRETSELLLGLTGEYDRVIRERATHSRRYRQYLEQRDEGAALVFSPADI